MTKKAYKQEGKTSFILHKFVIFICEGDFPVVVGVDKHCITLVILISLFKLISISLFYSNNLF